MEKEGSQVVHATTTSFSTTTSWLEKGKRSVGYCIHSFTPRTAHWREECGEWGIREMRSCKHLYQGASVVQEALVEEVCITIDEDSILMSTSRACTIGLLFPSILQKNIPFLGVFRRLMHRGKWLWGFLGTLRSNHYQRDMSFQYFCWYIPKSLSKQQLW